MHPSEPEPEAGDAPADALDQAIALAFGQPASAGKPAALPDAEAFPLPERYAFVAVVGRGGVGTVVRAHDRQLERDVAIKVQHREHSADPARAQRFLEEAQIVAQLQHPGVVPVHEVGLLDDGRPYFAMQLVEGRSLAAVLGDCATPTDGRASLLDAFERIVETVAFAHARGVVHRDLKPANIMLGPFGQAQVMDWGMAKVRADLGNDGAAPLVTLRTGAHASVSVHGSVFGTPGYLAPEQARGETDRLDERCDVFGLGAILCEILTGAPAHTGGDADAMLARAAAGDLEDAQQRLAGCGADPALVQLAGDCLRAERDARPREASLVAGRLRAWRESVAEAARQVELSRSRAAAERRARQFAVGLLLLLVALVVVAWWWQQERAGQQRDADAAATAAIAAVEPLHARALQDGGAEAWAAVLAAARQSVAVATQRLVSAGVMARAQDQLGAIEGEAVAAETRARQDAADRAMLGRLTDIRLACATDWDWRRTMRAYPEAFAAYGIDCTDGDESAAAVAVRRSAIADGLVTGLDQWSSAARNFGDETASLRARLRHIADAADEDQFRKAVRSAVADDKPRLLQLLEQADPARCSVQSLTRLIDRLASAGEKTRALALARVTWLVHPGDFWLAFQLAWLAFQQDPPDHAQEAQWFAVCVALRPDSAAALTNLGAALAKGGRLADALAAFDRAIALRPEAMAFFNRGGAQELLGQPEAAEASYREAVRLAPDHQEYHRRLTRLLIGRGRFDDARVAFAAALQRLPDDLALLIGQGALLCDRLGQLDAAEASFQRALAVDARCLPAILDLSLVAAKRGQPDTEEQLLERALTVDAGCVPAHVGLARHAAMRMDWAASRDHARAAIAREPKHPEAWFRLGNALFELEGDAAAITAYEHACAANAGFAEAWFDLGLSRLHLAQFAGAAEALEHAVALRPAMMEAHWNLGMARLGLDDALAAVTNLRAALDLDAGNPQLLDDLCVAECDLGDLPEAIAVARRLATVAPDRRFRLGLVLADSWQDEAALAELRVAAASGDLRAHTVAGTVLARLGRFEEALVELRQGDLGQDPAGALGRAEFADCEAIVALQQQHREPSSASEPADLAAAARLARLCAGAGRFDAAFRYWQGALREAHLPRDDARHLAARAALGAAAADPSGAETYRDTALAWLRADLAEHSRSESPAQRAHARVNAHALLLDPELAPARELVTWSAFWQEVAAAASRPQ